MHSGPQSTNLRPAKTQGSSLGHTSHADWFSQAHPALQFRPTAQSRAAALIDYILAPHRSGPSTMAAPRLIALPLTLPTTAHAAHNKTSDRCPTPRQKPASAVGPTALLEDLATQKSTPSDNHDACN